MANILYGVNGEGSGHSSRARELITHLQTKGHRVHVASFDRGLRDLKGNFEVTEIGGLRLMYVHNRVRYTKTVLRNLLAVPQAARSIRALQRKANSWDLDLVITFFKPSVKKKRTFLFPPILREAVLRTLPFDHDFVLVYLTSAAAELTDVLKRVNQRFVCYGFNREGKDRNVEFRRPGLDTFLRDLSQCRAVIANAGFSLISEALYLGKPYLAWPVKRQFEQVFNAYYIDKRSEERRV